MSSTRIGGRRKGSAKIARACAAVCVAVCAAVLLALPAQSQAWRLVADGETLDWSPPRLVPVDSAEAAAALALAHLQSEGFLLATVDSARAGLPPTLYARRGPRPRVAAFALDGTELLDADAFLASAETRPDAPYAPDALARDLDRLLARYERLGRPLAEARPTFALDTSGETPTVRIEVAVGEGPPVRLLGVELAGRTTRRSAFAERVIGLRRGAPLAFDRAAIRRDLDATGLFESVGSPVLAVGDSGAVVRVPVEEGPPGVFDLVLGYLPPTGSDEGAVVGNGRIELRNLFGGGRTLRLRLVRNPGLASEVEVRAADPFFLGLPLAVEGMFEGYTQDSLFARTRFGGEVGYALAPGLVFVARASREEVEPGIFGSRIVDGRPRVAASSALFGGVGLRYRQTDRRFNPSRGLWVEVLGESGVKRRSLPADTSGFAAPVSVRQQRLTAAGRLFVPTFRRQTFATGGEASVLLGGRAAGGEGVAVYDEGDLFRIGGAASLRGYDESRFVGRVVARALAEYRYALDPASFAFLFFDLGYVDRPALPERSAQQETLPGYGLGVRYGTPLGLVTVSYALNPDLSFGQGKVHVGLSFGL